MRHAAHTADQFGLPLQHVNGCHAVVQGACLGPGTLENPGVTRQETALGPPPAFSISWLRRCLCIEPLLQVDGLIMPSCVELGTPHLVHALMLGSAEGYRCPEPNVEVVEIFESSYEAFSIELTSIA